MRDSYLRLLCLAGLLLAGAGGCHRKGGAGAGSLALTPPAELGVIIGSLAEVVKPGPIAVEGYGLVGGLAGTGSGYCPPEVRTYLRQYILTQLPNERVNVDELIKSRNTAVVALEGTIPALPSMDEHFDVRVSLLPGSEATSIQGGWLYKSELVVKGTFGVRTRPLATVAGPVFSNVIGTTAVDLRNGYILGGGRTLYEYTAVLKLRKPDYRAASLIRNRLCERYGANIAQALSPGDISIRIPAEYRQRKPRFLALIPATFLEVTNELAEARINTYSQELASGDRENSEIVLEAVGRQSADQLASLLNASEAEVRLRAGRCLWSLGDDRGLAPLRDLALDPNSPYRLEALDAVMIPPRRAEAVTLAQRLLREEDKAIVLAAYESLRRIDDLSVSREFIGRSFLLEQVAQSSHKAIFVSRSGDPRVVLFGSPLPCRDNLFVEAPDQTVVLNARAGQDHIAISRKHPTRPGIVGPVRSRPNVADVVRTLGGEPVNTASGQVQNLGVSYAQVVAILQQMTVKDAVTAEFWAGPLPKIEPPVKK